MSAEVRESRSGGHGEEPGEMEQRMRDFLASVWFVALTALFFTVAVYFDVFAAGKAPLAEAAIVIFGGLPMTLSARWWRRRWKTTTLVACWLLALALILTPWHPRKRFVQRVESIRQGMTVDEVEGVLGGYIHGMGAKWQVPDDPGPLVRSAEDLPDPHADARARAAFDAYFPPRPPTHSERDHYAGTIVYRWNDHDAQFDSDMGFVEFADGRVVRVEFMSD
jgi:hypothetical protein